MTKKEKLLKWAEALESGKYKQNIGGWGSLALGKLCCLNVALVEFTGKEAIDDSALIVDPDQPIGVSVTSDLFDEDLVWVDQFIKWNDDDKLTFPQIAWKIREMAA